MSLLCGGLTQAGGAPGISGTGNTDGDTSGLKDTLEFGVALGSHPTTALLGGVKSLNGQGDDPLTTRGTASISILSTATDAGDGATGDYTTVIGSDAIGDGDYAFSAGRVAWAAARGSIAMGLNTWSLANHGIALGETARVNSGVGCLSIGSFTDATGNGAIALGGDTTTGAQATAAGTIAMGGDDGTNAAASATTGARAIAIGTGSACTGQDALAIGNGMSNSIADTWMIRGANLTPQAASETDWDKLAGCQITMVSPEDDATATGNNRFDFPSGVSMFVDEIDVVVTTLDGTVTTQPTTRAGSRNVADDAGNTEYFIAAALGTNLDTLRQRDRDTSMANDHAVTSLSGDITVAATLNTATVMGIRWVYKGYLLEDE